VQGFPNKNNTSYNDALFSGDVTNVSSSKHNQSDIDDVINVSTSSKNSQSDSDNVTNVSTSSKHNQSDSDDVTNVSTSSKHNQSDNDVMFKDKNNVTIDDLLRVDASDWMELHDDIHVLRSSADPHGSKPPVSLPSSFYANKTLDSPTLTNSTTTTAHMALPAMVATGLTLGLICLFTAAGNATS